MAREERADALERDVVHGSKRLFIAAHQRGALSLDELCRRYGVSRPTGYKWIQRFEEEALPGPQERSRRPKGCSHETAIEITEAILDLRRRHPFWGAKKLLTILERRHPNVQWAVRSTVCDLLSRHGMVDRKRRRRYPGHPGKPSAHMERTGDGVYCYQLTVTDGASRFLLGCQAPPSTAHETAKPVFRGLFQEYGLPRRIRSDNGVPFATTAIGRLADSRPGGSGSASSPN